MNSEESNNDDFGSESSYHSWFDDDHDDAKSESEQRQKEQHHRQQQYEPKLIQQQQQPQHKKLEIVGNLLADFFDEDEESSTKSSLLPPSEMNQQRISQKQNKIDERNPSDERKLQINHDHRPRQKPPPSLVQRQQKQQKSQGSLSEQTEQGQKSDYDYSSPRKTSPRKQPLSSPMDPLGSSTHHHLRKRTCQATLRRQDESKPMAWDDRFYINMKKTFQLGNTFHSSFQNHENSNNEKHQRAASQDDDHSSKDLSETVASKKRVSMNMNRFNLKWTPSSRDLFRSQSSWDIFRSQSPGIRESSQGNSIGRSFEFGIDDSNGTIKEEPGGVDDSVMILFQQPEKEVEELVEHRRTISGNIIDDLDKKSERGWLTQAVPSGSSSGQDNKATGRDDKGNDGDNKNINNNDIHDDSNDHPEDPLLNQSSQTLINRPFRKSSYSISSFFHWTFRVNFIVLFALMSVGFFGLIIIFASLFVVGGERAPSCILIGGNTTFDHSRAKFADAFTLSWTTFSTVGYGSVAPALGSQSANGRLCTYITGIASLESFVGILFSGFCGAILFGKVLRIQSHAQVIFSDPVVIRYGVGAINSDDDHPMNRSDDDDEEKNLREQQHLPFPVLEFRIINLLYDQDGGEIMDATLNVVAKIEELDQANEARASATDYNSQHSNVNLRSSLHRASTALRRFVTTSISSHKSSESIAKQRDSNDSMQLQNETNNDQNQQNENKNIPPPQSFIRRVVTRSRMTSIRSNDSFFANSTNQLTRQNSNDQMLLAIEASGGDVVEGRERHKKEDDHNNPYFRRPHVKTHLYYKMTIEASDHPFFKRVWLARHILDDKSPLLKRRVKHLIRKNNNEWPYHKLNTADDIRNSLNFASILVSLNGVSNVSASSVYAQKIYDYFDVNIGYQFVNVLYRDQKDRSIGVDIELINDVCEQNGGGGEPL